MTSRIPSPEAAAAIRRLSNEVSRSGIDSDMREAASRTGGIPVYADLGGVLVVAVNGEVLRFDPETDAVSAVNDNRWRVLALARAARRFPEVSELTPARPPSAITCERCGAKGVVFDDIECGTCFGVGWVEGDSEQLG